MKRRTVPAILIGLAAALSLVLSGCTGQAAAGSSAVPGSSDIGRASITARGTGKVSGTPDLVTITLGVETRSESAAAALEENNRLSTDVITVLKTNGVADADLQTSQLSIHPSFNHNTGAITGYQVSNMVTVKLRDLSKAGAIIDTVGRTAGDAVRVHGLSFSIDDDTELRAAARTQAVQQAQQQAQQLADAAGVDLGPIYSIVETASSNPMPYPMMMDMAAGAESSVPLEAGSQEVVLQVDVVYEIAR